MVPPWTRVYRVQRDIPMPLVTSGVEKGNLRELALARMDDLGLKCRDVRTREAGIQVSEHVCFHLDVLSAFDCNSLNVFGEIVVSLGHSPPNKARRSWTCSTWLFCQWRLGNFSFLWRYTPGTWNLSLKNTGKRKEKKRMPLRVISVLRALMCDGSDTRIVSDVFHMLCSLYHHLYVTFSLWHPLFDVLCSLLSTEVKL